MQYKETLYKRNTNGSVQQWTIEVEEDKYRTVSGKKDGKLVTNNWTICTPKNVGKSNESTGSEQALVEAEAKYQKQLESNYFESIEAIDTGFKEPQLAKPSQDYMKDIDWPRGMIVDQKLNGIACIITKDGARSRNNKEFLAIPHILNELKVWFDLYPDSYIHGELYNPEHVNELNRIAELVAVTRKAKDITPELLAESEKLVQFHIYDGYGFNGTTVNSSGTWRRKALVDMWSKVPLSYCKPVEYKTCYTKKEMQEYYESYVSKGGEGVIIRNPIAEYQHKRTQDLLKYKKESSEEYKIIELEEGKGNWAGCAKAAWCELPNGKRDTKFKTNIEGSMDRLRGMWFNKDSYVGKEITVRYQEISPYGVPLFPYSDMTVRAEIE